jgi:hypothetical protein
MAVRQGFELHERPFLSCDVVETVGEHSGYVLAYILSQDAIDERLVSHVSAFGFFSETGEHFWVQANRDEAPVPFAERWPTHTSYCSQTVHSMPRGFKPSARSAHLRHPEE